MMFNSNTSLSYNFKNRRLSFSTCFLEFGSPYKNHGQIFSEMFKLLVEHVRQLLHALHFVFLFFCSSSMKYGSYLRQPLGIVYSVKFLKGHDLATIFSELLLVKISYSWLKSCKLEILSCWGLILDVYKIYCLVYLVYPIQNMCNLLPFTTHCHSPS